MEQLTLLGPFKQIVTMDGLPDQGPLLDKQLEVIVDGGVLIQNGLIQQILDAGAFESYRCRADISYHEVEGEHVLLPGWIDSHTHICYAGNRAQDYARRLAGESYLEIAKQGGGILSTVRHTRAASVEELTQCLAKRASRHLQYGVTTCEVKSGYGLDVDSELKMLSSIQKLSQKAESDSKLCIPTLIPTCLSAHVKAPEFKNHQEYLEYILEKILPEVAAQGLSRRVDIFVEEEAFDRESSVAFLNRAKSFGFEVTVHADQFSPGGALVAAEVGARSADHLEASGDADIKALKDASVVATVLPGASMGLGMNFAPARKMLDAGLCVTVASDWNPGSAPMGDLLMQAAVLGAYEKLSLAETLAAITSRARLALGLTTKGMLKPQFDADMVAFPCNAYQEVIYQQGALRPSYVWKAGQLHFQAAKNSLF